MTRVLALADQSKIGCITQRRFAKVGTKTHPQGAALDRNGLSVSTETACRFEPKSPVGNSEICIIRRLRAIGPSTIARATYLRNPDHRELFLSGLRLAAGEGA
jgi:hypothetical protein